jgi:hypothetical protein
MANVADKGFKPKLWISLGKTLSPDYRMAYS